MTNFLKTASAAAIALTLAACASSYGKTSNEAAMSETSNMEQSAMTDTAMKEKTPWVGGAAMYPSKTIVENASAASNLTTLVSLVKQSGLVETLSGPGPFTVFAPTNSAFDRVPAKTVAALTDPANTDMLTKVLTAHVIAGQITSADLAAALEGKSSYTATTISGDTLTFNKKEGEIRVADENGTIARIETADVMQSNGIVHVVNRVLVPK